MMPTVSAELLRIVRRLVDRENSEPHYMHMSTQGKIFVALPRRLPE